MDYASDRTKAIGDPLIEKQLEGITNEKVLSVVRDRLKKIEEGERDFRF